MQGMLASIVVFLCFIQLKQVLSNPPKCFMGRGERANILVTFRGVPLCSKLENFSVISAIKGVIDFGRFLDISSKTYLLFEE